MCLQTAVVLTGMVLLAGCGGSSGRSTSTSRTTTNSLGNSSTTTTNYFMTAGGQMITQTSAGQFFATPGTLTATVIPNDYLQALFHNPYSPLLQFYIPKYSYFQGLCYSAANLQILGQVRLIGSAFNSDSTKQILLAQGSMLTTDPDYLLGNIQPPHQRYTILEWKEVP
jgi:hypothetical protein